MDVEDAITERSATAEGAVREEAVDVEATAPATAKFIAEAPDAPTLVKADSSRVWQTTDAAETNAGLGSLQAQKATSSELAGLTAELRRGRWSGTR